MEQNSAVFVANAKPQEVANMVWAFATLGYSCPKLLEEVELRSAGLMANVKPQEVASIMWAAAVLGLDTPNESRVKFIINLWERLLEFDQCGVELQFRSVTQMHQFEMTMGIEVPRKKLPEPSVHLRSLMMQAIEA